jgi:hypothetical protein
VLTEGLLLHWQVRETFYNMIATGALVAYLPFLIVKIPLIQWKLFPGVVKTAYDRAGGLHRVMNSKDAYKKFMREDEEGRRQCIRSIEQLPGMMGFSSENLLRTGGDANVNPAVGNTGKKSR